MDTNLPSELDYLTPGEEIPDQGNDIHQVTIDDISAMTGLSVHQSPDAAEIDLACGALKYRIPTPQETAEIRQRVIGALANPKLDRAGAERLARWESGWQEILDRVQHEGYAPDLLTPQYFQHDILRFRGQYIVAETSDFEYRLYEILRHVLFSHHLTGVSRVVEFGCGTGINLLLLGKLFPELVMTGCDWAQPSQQIVKSIADATGRDMTGVRFDMFSMQGRNDVEIDSQTAVLTMHALEQLGGDFRPFLDYVRDVKPALCFHMEPISELYDSGVPFDEVALSYHIKRNYLTGFLTYLRELESSGKIDILEVRRLGFGSLHQEAYSLAVWRPR